VNTPAIHIGAMPRMTRDIVARAFLGYGWGVVDGPPDPAAIAPGTAPVVVVATPDGRLGRAEQQLLAAVAGLVVVVLDEHGRAVTRYALWPRADAREELSAAAIVTVVASAPAWNERFE
jgi:hypothetical protein